MTNSAAATATDRRTSKHVDKIGRPIHHGDVVTHMTNRQTAVVVGFVGRTRILVSTTPGGLGVWYADSTML